ncbi:G patch domain-containing protein 4 [Frankliniella fusca]|uniref:G patch domain-containing protein 4 n=1 Tax=Frankliniella fusca TaxID=407009 RepID=A0AAE1I0U9_9NEOP|nr:G patch domain-containing protein 4 [Frankliniella fusca]
MTHTPHPPSPHLKLVYSHYNINGTECGALCTCVTRGQGFLVITHSLAFLSMDFAKRQLEKYGWSEGQGLGKNSTGITTALKPKVKLNTAGIGHDPAQEFTYRWWEDAFNSAASNINIEKTQEGIEVKTVSEDSTEISAVKRAKIKRDKMQYGAFVKRETLTKGGSVVPPENKSDPIEEAESRVPKLPPTLNDEQLFQACGGLTAHKAARHGHKLSGKLQRVKEQEEAFLKAYQNKGDGSTKKGSYELLSECVEEKSTEMSKKKKVREEVDEIILSETDDSTKLRKKNKKKERTSIGKTEETNSSSGKIKKQKLSEGNVDKKMDSKNTSKKRKKEKNL